MLNFSAKTQIAPSTQQNNLERNHHKELYTQKFQCICSKIFNTITEYQQHITHQNHDPRGSQLLSNQNPHQSPPNKLAEKSNQMMFSKSYPFFQSQNDQQKNIFRFGLNLNQSEERFFIGREQDFDRDRIQQRLELQQSQMREHFEIQIQQEQKQLSLKYIQAYYMNKLSPFYRQFDIDPQINPMSHIQPRQNQSSSTIPNRNTHKSHSAVSFTQQTCKKDRKKVLEQFDIKMIPVENGIIELISHFIIQNQQQIQKCTQEQIDAFLLKFQSSLAELVALYNNKRLLKTDEQFMDSDLDVVLGMFVDFLCHILKKNQFWVALRILQLVVHYIKQFYLLHDSQIEYNLTISDFSLILDTVKSQSCRDSQASLLKIEHQTVCQFLMWFSQWFTMVQYVRNKWSVSHIEQLFENINHINDQYRQNVKNYQACVQNKRRQYERRMKRKRIQKDKNRDSKARVNLQHKKILQQNTQHFNQNVFGRSIGQLQNLNDKRRTVVNEQQSMGREDFGNIICHVESKEHELDKNKRLSFIHNPNGFAQEKQLNFNHYNYTSGYQPKQTISQSSHLHESQDNEPDDLDSKSLYIPPIYKSKYVSYFSQESIDFRKKQKLLWSAKLQELIKIVQDPRSFKSTIREQVQIQLQEVQSISNFLHFQISLPNVFKQQFQKFERYYPSLSKIMLENKKKLTQNKNILLENKSIPIQNKKIGDNEKRSEVNDSNESPFSIIKNYRRINANELLELNPRSMQQIKNHQLQKFI